VVKDMTDDAMHRRRAALPLSLRMRRLKRLA
jgi:hypothetical protein